MIWQTMMGTSRNPKPAWNIHDENYQHFSAKMGSANQCKISSGDILVIYWPGHRAYMGISVATESGPYLLDMTGDYWDRIRKLNRDVDNWKYGLKIRDLIRIKWLQNGVTLQKAKLIVQGISLPGRAGLRDATLWRGIDRLIDLIRIRSQL